MRPTWVLLFVSSLVSIFCCRASGIHLRTEGSAVNISNEGDSIEIEGRFLDSCTVPASVKIAEYEVDGGAYVDVAVNKNKEFTYRLYIKGPKLVALRSDNAFFEFLVSPKENTYHIEIKCGKNKVATISIKNSIENKAFVPFDALNNKLMDTLRNFSHSNLSDRDTFLMVKKIFLDYQNKISAISKSNPGTLTVDVIRASELLPKNAFSSIQSLHDVFLRREIFANPQFYELAIPARIVSNYLTLFHEMDTSFAEPERALAISLKNPAAAESLQSIYYDIFFNRHREPLFVNFIKWADQHPGDMFNDVVKYKLQVAQRTMPGNLFIDFQLNDSTGVPKALSETVFSSKLTLLIFYSPTCPHCQLEIPQLVPLWEKYKTRGLSFFTVGFEAKNSEWHDFIKKKLSPEWVNVFDFSEKYDTEAMYMVTYTPTYILIDQQGKIISRYGTLESIMQKVPEVMATFK